MRPRHSYEDNFFQQIKVKIILKILELCKEKHHKMLLYLGRNKHICILTNLRFFDIISVYHKMTDYSLLTSLLK